MRNDLGNQAYRSGKQEDALRPRPAVTEDTSFFWEGARDHRLLIQRCGSCHNLRHPPTAACANCGSLEWDAIESDGEGTLFSYTVVHHPIAPPFSAPHPVGLVTLTEGTRIIAELVHVDPGEITIGMPLVIEWIDCDEGLSLPAFRPEASYDG